MQVQVSKLSPVLVEFDVQITADRVSSELDKAYMSVAKSAKVRGFRPGRAPRKVLTHMFGERILRDVAQRLVDETFPQAVTEHKLQPVSSPAFEPQRLSENQPFTYKARFEIIPEIEKVDYEGLEAKRPKTEIGDAEVDAELDKLRQAHATLEAPAAARPARKGDVVTIDFGVWVGETEIDGAAATDFQTELGSGQLIAAIDEVLIDKSVGDQASVDVEMPQNHPHPQLKGKTATFKITLKDLKERVLPDADDEFAKDLGEYEALADLKRELRERLEKQAKEQVDNNVAEQLVLDLVKRNPIPVPPSLVERQLRVTEQEILARARSQGQQVSGVGDELRGKLVQDSEIKVRAGLLMAEIAKREGIKIGDKEIEDGLSELAQSTGKNVAKVRAEYRDAKKREMLIGMILENKVLDIIEAKAKIEDA
jgi:trigger factor